MTNTWEESFRTWASPPSKTQQEKAENADRAVCEAVRNGTALKDRTTRVMTQGSYCNRTNVRIESDVDICVLCTDSIFFDVPDGMTAANFNITTPAPYSYTDFKNDVEKALVARFGRPAVTRGKKAFDVHENSYRVDADAIACFEYRRYGKNGTYLSGTAFMPDGGSRVINWPQQNYDNGVAKNTATNRRFKAMVRILKHLRNRMDSDGVAAAVPIPSFLIECLVWNVPNEGFGHSTYTDDLRWALLHLWNNTRTDDTCSEWGEINELKYLFRQVQPWTRQQVNAFVQAAWNYVGYK